MTFPKVKRPTHIVTLTFLLATTKVFFIPSKFRAKTGKRKKGTEQEFLKIYLRKTWENKHFFSSPDIIIYDNFCILFA